MNIKKNVKIAEIKLVLYGILHNFLHFYIPH